MSKLDCDQPLTGKLLTKWHSLISNLLEAQTISLRRHYVGGFNLEVKSYCLNGFCDTSMSAYAVVVYLAVGNGADRLLKFVTSKTQVAPLKTQTIPRLELLSALLLARLVKNVTHSLEPELSSMSPKCFTDFPGGTLLDPGAG